MSFIDVHGHYAWGIDDGIPNQEEAVQALKRASHNHIQTIVATPHLCCGKNTMDDVMRMKERMEDLKVLAKQYGITVYFGCELMLNEDTRETLEQNLFIPFENTRYLLCEENVRKTNNDFYEVFDFYLKEVIFQGYTPIIAHVERYTLEEIDLDYIKYLIDLGCVIQINTTNVLGKGHPIHFENARKLIDKQLVHIIATDTHTADGHRRPNMQVCYDYLIKKEYPKEYVDLLMYGNQQRILNNQDVIQPNFKMSGIKKLLSKLIG